MKWMTWILLVANLAVAGFFIGRGNWSDEAATRTASLNVDRLSLRSQSTALPGATPAATVAAPPALCLEWRGLNREEFIQVRQQLKSLAGERVMSFTEVPLNTRQWSSSRPCPVRNRPRPS